MARQEITLTHVTINPDTGAIEVGHTWNGQAGATPYIDAAALLQDSQDQIVSHDQAARALRYYLLNLGYTAETLHTAVGKTLVMDSRQTVEQIIALVEAQ